MSLVKKRNLERKGSMACGPSKIKVRVLAFPGGPGTEHEIRFGCKPICL